MITAEDLRQEIENLSEQQAQALATYHQATGALALAEAILAKLELEPAAMPMHEFAEMIGGNGAVADITPLEKEL